MILEEADTSSWSEDTKMINVLTIEREFGSGANVIAEKLSSRLGWKLWDQLFTTEVARYLDCEKQHVEKQEERRDPLYYRLMKSFMRGSFEGSLNAPKLKLADAEGIRAVSEKLVRRAAAEGNCVLVGRGAAYYLHGSPDVFNIFIYAPFEERVRRLRETGYGESEAIELAQTVDSERAAFIKQNFDVDWPQRHYFHLMINSEMSDDCVVQTILAALNAVQTCSFKP
jgi:cytidylate kinase